MIAFSLQFSFLFMGLYVGMSPGMASIVMQTQVFFSLFFAMIFLGEQPKICDIVFSLVVWGSFVAFIPMLALSLIIEGPKSIMYTYYHVTWVGVYSLLYTVYLSTLIGYGVWNWLLSRYAVGVIVPFTLLVPIVGVLSSILVLGEPFERWKLVAGLLVVGGLCINLLRTYLGRQRVVSTA